MFSNEDINSTLQTKVKLSAFGGGKYIEYDAFENKAVVRESDGEIDINLAPYHSTVLIFGDVSFDDIPVFEEVKYESERVVTPQFDISVAQLNGKEFKHYKTTDKLPNITGRNEMPTFSGHIKYEGVFEAEGRNEITVIVTNHKGYAMRDKFSQYLLFEASGLGGPIKLQKIKGVFA